MTRAAQEDRSTAGGPWTTRRLLDWMSGALDRAGVESGRLCAEMLVSHVLGCERLRLYMDPDRPASRNELAALRELTARALKHEPVQYLVGEAWFFSLPFAVDRRVLIPRACTEAIVEEVVQRAGARARGADAADGPAAGGTRDTRGVAVLDLCTGSGCIGVAVAKHLPSAAVTATDLSEDALEVARVNAARHAVGGRIEFLRGDLWGALAGRSATFDVITANPPYIPDAEWDDPSMMGRNVKGWEPETSLRGGADGLALVRPILEGAPARLRAGGVVLVEVAASTAGAAEAIAGATPGLVKVRVMKDLEGLPRVVIAERGGDRD